MLLPAARGPLTRALADALRGTDADAVPAWQPSGGDPVVDDDVQLALWICFELHYRGFDDVADSWEWQPALIGLRRQLEAVFLDAVHSAAAVPADRRPIAERLRRLVDADDGPSLSRYLQRTADREQFLEFAVHRSVYHVKEADPHSWAIPRLSGRAKAALIEIQADEYGGGNHARMHSELFRRTLRGLGLDDSYGYYVDAVPAVTLAISNLMSLFGLRRELRGALVGHLAAFEMTSSEPNRRYSQALRRLGSDEGTRRFYDEHVTADALHEQLAMHDLCGSLVADEPALTEDVAFGAAAALYLDDRFSRHVLACWQAGGSSLRAEAPTPSRALAVVS
jgi:heme oxygenase-like protein